MITSEMITYMNDILYIGLRGSRSIGLDVETSDYDMLVIVKDSFPHTDVLAGRKDVIWFREKAFIKNFNKEEITSHFTILPHKVHGFFALMEHRSTKQIRIIPDAEGFCTEELSNQQEAMIE